MEYVAFFDLDNTIIKINSGEALLRRGYKNGLLSTGKLIHTYYLLILYKAHLIDSLKIIEKLCGWLAESTIIELETLCDEVVEKDLLPAIRREIITEIRMHKEKGNLVVILSSALAEICLPVGKHLGVDDVICSELEVVNQRYTGRTKTGFCFKNEKLRRMNEYLSASNLLQENSSYYADSIDDLLALLTVGHAVCVSPDRRLEKAARQHNWVVHNWV